jgi:hypothetical protein
MTRLSFILVLVLTAFTTIGQTSLHMGGGLYTDNTPLLDLGARHRQGRVLVQGGYTSHLTRYVNHGTLFHASVGWTTKAKDSWVAPYAGYGMHLRSSDYPSMNFSAPLVGILFAKRMKKDMVYFNAAMHKETLYVTVGLSATLRRDRSW